MKRIAVISLAVVLMLIPLMGMSCDSNEDNGDGTETIIADFAASATSGTAPLEVQFTDNSTGEITDWAWDFDNDGGTDSTQQNPSYSYDTPGTYTVSLTVTGKDGSDAETKTVYVNVSSLNSVSWDTGYVSLEADDFYIVANGEYFYADVIDVSVSSDPGSLTYCSLELEWEENGVEMRLFIYFYANQSYWWSDEIRTYNGQVDSDWIYYTGMFFKTSIGTAFTGDVDLQSDDDNDYEGEIHFENLTLQAF